MISPSAFIGLSIPVSIDEISRSVPLFVMVIFVPAVNFEARYPGEVSFESIITLWSPVCVSAAIVISLVPLVKVIPVPCTSLFPR